MEIKLIKTRTAYRAVLKEVDTLMMARSNTFEDDRLDVLVTLVEAYEHKHFSMDLPDPVEAINFGKVQ